MKMAHHHFLYSSSYNKHTICGSSYVCYLYYPFAVGVRDINLLGSCNKSNTAQSVFGWHTIIIILKSFQRRPCRADGRAGQGQAGHRVAGHPGEELGYCGGTQHASQSCECFVFMT